LIKGFGRFINAINGRSVVMRRAPKMAVYID
jgi:hypothetical protein